MFSSCGPSNTKIKCKLAEQVTYGAIMDTGGLSYIGLIVQFKWIHVQILTDY